jgi:hypothetical protein
MAHCLDLSIGVCLVTTVSSCCLKCIRYFVLIVFQLRLLKLRRASQMMLLTLKLFPKRVSKATLQIHSVSKQMKSAFQSSIVIFIASCFRIWTHRGASSNKWYSSELTSYSNYIMFYMVCANGIYCIYMWLWVVWTCLVFSSLQLNGTTATHLRFIVTSGYDHFVSVHRVSVEWWKI